MPRASTPSLEPVPSAAGSARDTRCLSRAEVEADEDALRAVRYRITGPLSVVNVAPSDVLHLRSLASASAPVIAKLRYDEAGIEPTGALCFVQSKPWLEVKSQAGSGWVNAAFVAWATPARDATDEYEAFAGKQNFASAEALASALMAQLRQRHGIPGLDYTLKSFGIQRDTKTPDRARLELVSCCFGDDSIQGEQLSLVLERPQGRPGWRVASVRVRQLCYRGVSGDLCV